MTTHTRRLWTEFTGGWCDTCTVAARAKRCPACQQVMRPAKVRVEPTDVRDEEWPR